MNDISYKPNNNKHYPIVFATIFSVVVLLHTMLMTGTANPLKALDGHIYWQRVFIMLWHIAIALAYFIAVIYAYKKRDSLSQKKINFLVISGFLLYIFLSFSGCFILSKISMH